MYRYRPKPYNIGVAPYFISDITGNVHFSSPKKFNDVLEVPITSNNQKLYVSGYRGDGGAHKKDLRDVVLMACFSENWNNSAMWYHYASAHKGICIEYDIEKLFNLGDKK